MSRKLIGAVLIGWAAAGAVARAADHMVIVADTRRFTGWRAWWTDLYNESHLLFALATVITIPAIALALGRCTSWVLGRLGINLRSRELAEH